MEFNKGEIVKLKSEHNQTEMLVFSVWPGNHYICIWFDQNSEFYRMLVHGSNLNLVRIGLTQVMADTIAAGCPCWVKAIFDDMTQTELKTRSDKGSL